MVAKKPPIKPSLSLLTKSIFDLRSEAELTERAGARHTNREYKLLSRMIEIAIELGAAHPERPLSPADKEDLLQRVNDAWQAKAGASHSRRDLALIQELHDVAGKLGAECRRVTRGPYSTKNTVIKGQNDAPNYLPADSPEACENCGHFDEIKGNEYCGLYDFITANNYACDSWKHGKPDYIPGYEGKALTTKNWENSTADQRAGRDAINNAIKSGKLAKAHTKMCRRCGNRKAEEYHHVNGYSSKARKLKVIPVCSKCHSVIDPNRKKAAIDNVIPDDLAVLMGQILIMRGGRTSGNWAHSGRKGKRGGSGRGGGFKRIKIKPGSSRKKIKAAAKKAKKGAKGGKASGDKVKATKKPQAKAKKVTTGSKKLDGIFDKAPRDSQAKFQGHILDRMSTGSISFQDAQKLNKRFVDEGGAKKPTQKKAAKKDAKPAKGDTKQVAAAKSTLASAAKKRDAELKEVSKLEKRQAELNGKLRRKLRRKENVISTLNSLDDAERKLKGRTSENIKRSFADETKAASDAVFNDNVTKAKSARQALLKQSKSDTAKLKSINDEMGKSRDDTANGFKAYDKTKSRLGENHPDTIKAKEQFDAEIKKSSKLRSDKAKLENEIRKNAINSLAVDNPSSVGVSLSGEKVSKETRKDWENTMGDFSKLVSSDVVMPGHDVDFSVKASNERENASRGKRINVNGETDGRIVAHEVAHTLEHENPRLHQRAVDWRNNRTKGEDLQKLSDLTGNDSYNNDEKTRPDKFIEPYIGKDYGRPGSSEVISMGVEMMFNDPVKFAKEDPDMFDFIYAVMRSG